MLWEQPSLRLKAITLTRGDENKFSTSPATVRLTVKLSGEGFMWRGRERGCGWRLERGAKNKSKVASGRNNAPSGQTLVTFRAALRFRPAAASTSGCSCRGKRGTNLI